jgi:hypothetical protein
MIAPGNKFVYGDLAPLVTAANAVSSTMFDLSQFYNVAPMYQGPTSYNPPTNNYGFRQLGGFAIVSPGHSFKVGDVVTSPGGCATFEVCSVNAGGGIMGMLIQSNVGYAPGTDATTAWETINDPTLNSLSPLTGGSGSGATLTWTVGQVGPTAAYALPDYALNRGYITALTLNQGGTAYQVGDVLAVPDLSFSGGTSVTVSAVNGSGMITGWGVTTPGCVGALADSIPMPLDVGAMPVTGGHGTGATFAGMYVLVQRPAWLDELNRLRNAIYNLTELNSSQTSILSAISPAALCVSGPWPVGGPTSNFLNTWFYFAGTAATVTVASQFSNESTGPYSTKTVMSDMTFEYTGDGWWSDTNAYFYNVPTIPGDPPDPEWAVGQTVPFPPGAGPTPPPSYTIVGKQYTAGEIYWCGPGMQYSQRPTNYTANTVVGLFATRMALSFIIGGSKPLYVSGGVAVQFLTGPVGQTIQMTGSTVLSTTPDGTDPASLVSVDGASTMPGAIAIMNTPSPGNGAGGNTAVWVVAMINQTLAPGKYTLILNVACPDDTFYQLSHADTSMDANNICLQTNYSVLSTTTTRTRIQALGLGQMQPYLQGFGSYTYISGVFAATGYLTAGTTYTDAVPANGIHSSSPVSKIQVGGDVMGNGSGIGTCMQDVLNYDAYGYGPTPYPQPIMGPECDRIAGLNITTSVPGLWLAQCQAVSNLNMVGAELMPWNLMRTKAGVGGSYPPTISVNPMLLQDLAPLIYTGSGSSLAATPQPSGSYVLGTPCEQQAEPPRWVANRFFPPNFTLLDPNGNYQKSGNGAISGPTPPNFASGKGQYTYDNWTPGPGVPQGLTWNCIKVPTESVTPAQHRIPDIPRYPVYWSSETLARLMPPTSTSGLTIWGANDQWQRNGYPPGQHDAGWQQDNLAYGWWIYSVSVNRCQYPTKTRGPVASAEFGAGGVPPGAGDSGASGTGAGGAGSDLNSGPVMDSSEISVTIGCMRTPTGGGAAVFVPFGSYMTGETYQVFWPVFTSYALVYQASERVDVQAMAINNTVICAAQIPPPGVALVAAFVTDTEALLKLI